jgi:hypothetical protein
MKMKIIACCIMAALQQCCLAQGGGGGGGFGGLRGAAAVGPQVTTTGTVFDPSGAPDPNASLTVWRTSRPVATTNADAGGKYSIQWQAPATRANAAQIKSTLIVRDQARNFVATRELDETNTRLDLRLREGLSLSGSVQDPGGKPLTGFDVRLAVPVNNWPSALDRTLTDAQGSFNFNGLPQGEDCSLIVNLPLSTAGVGAFTIIGSAVVPHTNPVPSSGVSTGGYGFARATLAAKDTRTNHYAFPVFVLRKADRKVAGHVLDADNKPLAGAILRLNGEGQPLLPSVTTDQQGRFAVDGVCEGPLRISVITIPPGPGGGVPTVTLHGAGVMSIWSGAPGVGVTAAALNAVNGQDIRAGDTNLVLKLGDKPPETNAPQPAL